MDRRKPGDAYFTHGQRRALAGWIVGHNARGVDTVAIGHSWGAVSAARVVADGHQVYELRTVDPVSRRRRFRSDSFLQRVARHAEVWHNYDSTSTSRTRNNLIARLGGPWDDLPEPFATEHFEIDLDHAEICAVYCEPVP